KTLSERNPDIYKELYVYSTCFERGGSRLAQPEISRFSHEEEVWGDLIISDAIRASLSIPGIFMTHTLHFKDATGQRHAREHHGKFIDGGLIRNYPIDAFDDEKYQEDRCFRGDKTNRRTLGLSLVDTTPSEVEVIEETHLSGNLVKNLISTYYNAEQILMNETGKYRDRSIIIPVSGVSLTDFNISEEKKAEIILAGRSATHFFLAAT
ncbi:MAG: patatin-like phospholipase family protein, partial [Silvanigrellaceae bacterium]|nr:patatin-like phospholipase family protein [Silvanigrellaceae bacterium]